MGQGPAAMPPAAAIFRPNVSRPWVAGGLLALLAAAALGFAGVQAPPPAAPVGALADLPLVVTPAAGPPSGLTVVMYSGDGGWAAIDRVVAGRLARRGAAVVGVNALRYYRTPRSPAGAAADLARILHTEASDGEVALVGYSFGADPLPFLAARLPADLRARVRRVVLVSPTGAADFRFQLLDWLRPDPEALATAPALRALGGAPVCLYGADDRKAACARLAADGLVRAERLPGGHHFARRYGAVGDAVAAALGLAGPLTSGPQGG